VGHVVQSYSLCTNDEYSTKQEQRVLYVWDFQPAKSNMRGYVTALTKSRCRPFVPNMVRSKTGVAHI